jgi:uncharacterized protein YbjT (DUF2867 family)
MTDTLLIVGATGRVGGFLFDLREQEGHSPIAMSHRPEEANDRLPRVRAGDLREPQTLPGALEGVDVAFLVTPLGPDETEAGLAFIEAAEKADVRKIVYIAIMNIEAMAEIPHFATKLPVRERLLSSGQNVAIAANFFMPNVLLAAPALKAGVYPLPSGSAGVSSVYARDVARASMRAMTLPRWDGRAMPVCGPDRITGEAAAETYGAAAGRPFFYPGDAVAPFIAAISAAMPMDEWVENDLRKMMEVTQRLGCPATPEDHAACEEILGQPPRTYGAFVAETVSDL